MTTVKHIASTRLNKQKKGIPLHNQNDAHIKVISIYFSPSATKMSLTNLWF